MSQSALINLAIVVLSVAVLFGLTETRVLREADERFDPTPSQDFEDVQRAGASSASRNSPALDAEDMEQQAASNEAIVPVYVSPYLRSSSASSSSLYDQQESSYALAHYQAPRALPLPVASAASRDLKASASYGHHGAHHYGHDTSGWLDMGAYTGGKGSFGWYADYPVGGKHHYSGHY